jgi:hypothetical protein
MRAFSPISVMSMKPSHPNIEKIKEFFLANNDIVGLLCTTRKYFKECAKMQEKSS